MWDPQDKVQEQLFGEVSDCPDLCQPTGSSLERAGLWKRGIKAKLVSLCLGFSEHWDIQSLSCQNLLPEPLTSCSAVVQGRGAGWDAWGGRNHGEFRGNAEHQGFVAQSTPSTWRGHSHGAGPALTPFQWEQLFGWGSLKGLLDLQPQRQSEKGPVCPIRVSHGHTESVAGSGADLLSQSQSGVNSIVSLHPRLASVSCM